MARARIRDSGLFPAGFIDTVIRRLIELAGLAMMMFAVLLAAALVSFDVADPSWNHASGLPALNLLGAPGAVFADLALRSVGIAAFAPVLSLAVWGWLLMGRHRIPHPAVRVGLCVAATGLLALALADAPVPPAWPLSGGLGGFIGSGLLHALAARLAADMLAAVGGVLGMIVLIWGFGLSWADWRATPARIRTAGGQAGRTVKTSAARVRRLAHTLFRRRQVGQATTTGPQALRRRTISAPPAVAAPEPLPAAAAIIAPKMPRAAEGRRAASARQGALDLEGAASGYTPPPLDLLHAPPRRATDELVNRDALEQNARMLATVLDDFGVRGEIERVRPGPVITLYELEPAPGTKTSRVIGLADDIARSMSAVSVRVAVVPGRNIIGIELPNQRRETVYLRDLLAAEGFERASASLTLALGKDIGGAPVYVDLARMPHLLIAGTTGSGKSVAINTMILSLVWRHAPETCRLILIDPKMLELSVYDGIPHLLTPVVTDPAKAVVALKWAVREMEERYRMMSQLGVRNISGFNARVSEASARGEALVRRVQTGFDEDGHPVYEDQPLDLEPLPFIVIIVDEMADLMLVAGKDIEAAVQRLAQMARAAGIHMVLATQRPSVDVITGTIKANFPTRISFRVASKIDSRTILGEQGAEQLLGQGDMLYMAGGARVTRIHGPFVDDREVEAAVSHLRRQGEPAYLEAVTEEPEAECAGGLAGDPGNAPGEDADGLYDQAVALVARDGKASTSYVQRRLQIGYNRAARLIERMEAEGVVSKPDRVGRREVLVGDHAD